MKKIIYWSPCLGNIGTIKSTLNSALSLKKFKKKEYIVKIINICGEWDSYKDYIESNQIELINLSFSYFKYLPKQGYLKSRLSYLLIFFISFFPLLFFLIKEKKCFFIAHLITSLPLFFSIFFFKKINFVLRISGYPKLNFIRKYFWSKIDKKIKLITCPTNDLRKELKLKNIFTEEKLKFLPDAILSSEKVITSRIKYDMNLNFENSKRIILSVGRLTKQKNFSYLIDEFKKFSMRNEDYCLYIIGEGEERKKLENKINQNDLQNKVYLLGHKKNVFAYMKQSEIFILSSLWEEVGFAMVEAAINNCYLICSDCPNGPSEFLNYGKNGILFKNNLPNNLYEKLLYYKKLDKEKIYKDKIILKKNALKYSKFKHYLKINEIINH